MAPEKENCIRMEKDIFTKLWHLMKVELVLWIGLQCGNHNYPPFWGYGLVPWESDPVLGKTLQFQCECRKFVLLFKAETFEIC